jgi:hypothetical protein
MVAQTAPSARGTDKHCKSFKGRFAMNLKDAVPVASYDLSSTSLEDVTVNVLGDRPHDWSSGALTATDSFRVITGEEAERNKYQSGSVLPTGDWYDCGGEGFLTSSDQLDLDHRVITHFCLDPESRQLAAEFLLQASSQPDVFEVERADFTVRIQNEMLHRLADRFGITMSAKFLGCVFNSPRLVTTTTNNRIMLFVGLHFDDWDGDGRPELRRRSRPRLCVNLGPGTRWLLFSPNSLDQLVKFPITNQVTNEEYFPKVQLVIDSGVMRRVLALRVLPGEGYIARTDAMIHDASTRWSPDANFSVQYLLQDERHTAKPPLPVNDL